MPQKIANARILLLEQGRQYLLCGPQGQSRKFSVRELTARCGMAPGTFYHYFKSKDDLITEIMDEDWGRLLDAVDAGEDEGLSLYARVRGIYELVSAFDANYRFSAMRLIEATPQGMANFEEKRAQLYARIERFLRGAMERGALDLNAAPENAAYLLVQLFLATGRNPDMDFDELWRCMSFRDNSAPRPRLKKREKPARKGGTSHG